jgi:RNA polymerase sporulation-specific sigma factor
VENDSIYRNIEEQVDRKLLQGPGSSVKGKTDHGRVSGCAEKKNARICRSAGISILSRLEKRIIKRLRKEFNKMV